MNKSMSTILNEFLSGQATDAYKYFGSHITKNGVVFRVWAPQSPYVAVVGDFNGWNEAIHPMKKIHDMGIWEITIPEAKEGDRYKYCVATQWGYNNLKTDPYSFYCEVRPDNATVIHSIDGYKWHDAAWAKYKKQHDHRSQPMNIYEINAGSWRKRPDGSFMTYRDLAAELVPYVKKMGYTHIEFMPLTEFPFDGSWGYQVTGYYAATSRYGTPQDLMYLIDECHRQKIGVILDWVPAHFPRDAHGLGRFDGTGCYEYEDWRIGEHKEWGTYIFNFGRYEVKSFLISSANFWIEEFHFDGIRVDAVASMLYLDYNRKDGEWLPNQYGGRENLVAVEFLQALNTTMHELHPTAMMIAEESTAWANVTGYPIKDYGLGFDYKWNMGWMNDMLRYIEEDPLWRNWHHNELTFSMMYAFTENFILPISHDEVVYGKGSLINKMPGSYEMKFQGIRGFLGFMMAHPGKKLLFMGSDIGQFDEWNAEAQLQWNLLDYDMHKKLNNYIAALNKFYREVPAMHENDYDWNGFRWVALEDAERSIIAFRRIAYDGSEVLVVCNFQPVTREHYRVGVPKYGIYKEVLNSEDPEFGGYGAVNKGELQAEMINFNNLDQSLDLTIPPLGTMYIVLDKELPVPVPEVEEEEEKEEKEEKEEEKASAEETETTETKEKAEKKAETKKTTKKSTKTTSKTSKAKKSAEKAEEKVEVKAEEKAEEAAAE